MSIPINRTLDGTLEAPLSGDAAAPHLHRRLVATRHGAAVRFDSVTKCFGDRLAVDALSFTIPEGSLYGFIGPNGSGKSTTLRMMLGILLPDEGQVHVLGQRRSKATDDSTGYLPEERGLYRRMRVNDALTFHANLKNVRQPKERIFAWLKKLDIADRGRVRISSLSKGLAQRVQFAAAVVHDPKLLILDEPFSGLDPVGTEQLREIILELKNSGTTVILSTHDMNVAESMCDKVLMLHRGRKVLDGSVEQLKLDNGHESIRLRFADRVPSLDDPDISRVLDFGREQVLQLAPNVDPQAVLLRVMRRATVTSFSIIRPSLHELFLSIARVPHDGEPGVTSKDGTGV